MLLRKYVKGMGQQTNHNKKTDQQICNSYTRNKLLKTAHNVRNITLQIGQNRKKLIKLISVQIYSRKVSC